MQLVIGILPIAFIYPTTLAAPLLMRSHKGDKRDPVLVAERDHDGE